MATKRIVGLQTLEYQELGEGDYVVIDNAKNGNKKVDLGSLVNNLNNSIDEIEQGTAIADGAIETTKLANGAITNDKVATDAIETDNILDAAITTDKLGSDAVTNAKLADNAVQTENLVTGAVTTDKLGADSVTNAKLADNAVQTENLVNESVTNAKLASDAVKTGNIVDENVTTAKLANGTVTTAKLGADAVTNAKLADNAVQTENIVDANVTTGKIANGAVTHDKVATDAVDSANIKSSAVITAKIANGAVTHDKVATDAIEAANIKDGEVGTSELASGAVTNDKLATDSVKTGNITDANVTTAKLATGAVTNTKLASSAVETGNIKDAAVTTDKIAAGAVTNLKLATDAVQTGNIKDGNVTNTKLASDAVGTSNIQNGSVTLAKIATGSEATQSASGLMSATDKTKLDGFSQASDYALKSDVSSAINYRGSVATEADLPSTGQKVGDMYNIVAASSYGAAGTNVAWTGSAWDSLGEKFTIGNGTLTPVMVSSGYNFMTDAEQTKLSGIETGANKTIVDNALSGSSTNPVQNSVVKGALDTKAPLASPALTGTPTAPTAASGTNTTQIATTAFVKSAVDAKFPVVNADVDTNAIATGNIQNSAVTTDKIYDGAVTHAKVASNAVETGNIKDGSVTTDKLASGAVTNAKLATDAVETANIKNANVTNAKLAANAVEASNIKDGEVGTSELATGAVTNAKLATDAVETANIKDANVTTDKLASGAVTNAKLATDAVEAGNIKDGEVGTNELAANAVTNAKLATDAVETTNIKDANVTVEKLSAPVQKQLNQLDGVIEYIRYGVKGLESDTWEYAAGLADYGDAVLDLLPIGTELTDKWNDTHTATAVNYDMPWLVQAVQKFSYENHDNPEYGIVLGSKYTLPFGTQFDAKEAFYAAPSGGVSAAVYYVTWGATWGSKITSGNSFSFTVTGAHPEGAQFEFSGDPYSNDIDTMKVYIYDTCGGTVKSEECQISAGIAEGATLLCTLGTSQIASGDDQNHLHRCVYANNRWDQSAIRQYLNTDADGGTWWTPQNKWDRPPSYAGYDGFMKGLPAEFKAVIQKTKIVTALSYSADAGTADAPEVVVTYDYFFLPSWEQHWLKIETYMGAKVGLEGTPFPYWQKVSGVTTPWAYNTTHIEYIHYDLANHNTARYVFLRSSSRSNGGYVSYIYSSGSCGNNYALSGLYVVPVCVIRKALA